MSERQRPQSKVSLEDLLRLKRAERPAPEFWAQFESQLRHKQLAAIVDKRPWWRRLSSLGLARIALPLGTTAVIAFTVISVRERAEPAAGESAAFTAKADSVSANEASVNAVPRSAKDALISPAVTDQNNPTSDRQAFLAADPVNASATERALAESSVSSNAQVAGEPSLAQVILGLNGTSESDARPRYQADESASLLASLDVLGEHDTHTLSPVEINPLTQVSSVRDDRRARLLASVDAREGGDLISGNSRVARSRERIANRLAEQSLYDSISRLGLNGDSVSIKF